MAITSTYSRFEHPNSVCMTYLEHMKLSLGFAGMFFVGSLKAIVHAFVPSLFITSTSDLNHEVSQVLMTAGCR